MCYFCCFLSPHFEDESSRLPYMEVCVHFYSSDKDWKICGLIPTVYKGEGVKLATVEEYDSFVFKYIFYVNHYEHKYLPVK